jgi:hypothetical protein
MIYIPECKQQLRKELRNNTQRYEILHTLNQGCNFITLSEPYSQIAYNIIPEIPVPWFMWTDANNEAVMKERIIMKTKNQNSKLSNIIYK